MRATRANPSVFSLVLAAVLGCAAVAAAQESATDDPIRHAREVFDQSDDKTKKSQAAFLLVLHEAEDPRYLEFLLDNARKALEGDPPAVIAFDEEGRAVRGELSEEFIAWATERGLDPEVAAGERLSGGAAADVVMVAAVATTDRPATVDLLLHALEARDPMIVVAAAEGLARLQVESARKRLVELTLSSGHDLAKSLALELLWYDDPETLAVAEKVLDDPELVAAARQQRALERQARQAASGEPD